MKRTTPPDVAGTASGEGRAGRVDRALNVDPVRSPGQRDLGIVRRYQAGDPAAAGEFVVAYRSVVLRFCLASLGDRERAEDATQDTLVQVLQHLATFDGGERLGHYVMRVAKYRCRDSLMASGDEARRSAPLEAAAAVAAVGPDPADVVVDRVTAADVLVQLSATHARLLVDRHVRGESPAEIARREGSTPGSVSVRLHRARKAAKSVMAASGLLSLSPVTALRSLWHRYQDVRFGGLQTSAAFAAAGLAAGVALAPTPGPSQTPEPTTPTRPAVEASFTTPTEADGLLGGRAAAPPGPTTGQATTASSAATPGVTRSDREPDTRGPIVRIPETTVPVTGSRVNQEPPPQHDTRIDVEVDGRYVAGVGAEDEEPTGPVHDPACDVARLAPGAGCRQPG